MAITEDLLDQLIKDYKKPEDLIGENGLLKQLTKRLLERAMQAEMTDHLGYPKNAPAGNNTGNSRNGSYKKKVKGDFGELDITGIEFRNSGDTIHNYSLTCERHQISVRIWHASHAL